METIRNYLESVFCRFPATPEYAAVKQELLQKMQERYTALLESGYSQNEAVGTVIAECGNAEELLEQRGLLAVSGDAADQKMVYLSAKEAEKYYAERKSKGVLTGVGVLFVLMGAGLMTGIEGVREYFDLSDKVDIVAVVAFFMLLLPAVFMLVYSGMSGGEYGFIQKGNFYLDQETKAQIEQQSRGLHCPRCGRVHPRSDGSAHRRVLRRRCGRGVRRVRDDASRRHRSTALCVFGISQRGSGQAFEG